MSTFASSLGEVALQPSTGGTFTVSVTHAPLPASAIPAATRDDGDGEERHEARAETTTTTTTTLLWDRKTEGGFPDAKELKRRVRDAIQPGRDLGHVDRHHPTAAATSSAREQQQQQQQQPPPPLVLQVPDSGVMEPPPTPAPRQPFQHARGSGGGATTATGVSCRPGPEGACEDCE